MEMNLDNWEDLAGVRILVGDGVSYLELDIPDIGDKAALPIKDVQVIHPPAIKDGIRCVRIGIKVKETYVDFFMEKKLFVVRDRRPKPENKVARTNIYSLGVIKSFLEHYGKDGTFHVQRDFVRANIDESVPILHGREVQFVVRGNDATMSNVARQEFATDGTLFDGDEWWEANSIHF